MSFDWQAYWGGRTAVADGTDDLLIQVGKTQFGVPVGSEQVELLVEHVGASLAVDPTAGALDLGCGNGLVTALLAPRLARVVGLDYSDAMLATARTANGAPNVTYQQVDLRNIAGVNLAAGPYQLAWSIEVVQNLDPESLAKLLSWLSDVMVPGFRFLASGIPDAERIRNFYNTPERWQVHLDNEAAGREAMGRWWSRAEITEAADRAGVTAEFRALPGDYYTSHYRFDVLFQGAR